MGGKNTNKSGYFDKLQGLLEEYKSVFIVEIDNVSSQQMHEIRHALRKQAVVLMGKNTMVRRALKTFIPDHPEYERFLPHVKGNVGFVFTNGDLKEIRDKILENRVAAPARAGALAPADVWIPAGNTGMEPGKTSFFQALGVPTKIARGTIEITTDLKLVEAGSKVGPSEATLLNMLNISPFTYGLGIAQVYDEGQTFPASVLDIGEEELLKTFASAITTIASVSLAIGFPTLPSVMHSVVNGYKNILAVAIGTEFSWPEIEELKDRIANPDAYAAAAPAAGGAAATTEAAGDAKKEESEAEDSDESGFGGLLYVLPRPPLYSSLLTRLAAIKRRATRFTTTMCWIRSHDFGSRDMIFSRELHRSPVGRLNPSQRDNETRFPMNKHDMTAMVMCDCTICVVL
ncbi:60S acidic ribosomal protein P0 [Emericellopsis atlantica]|uniref:Large ribosomal subunit protein uL10 n=1 Tax=Emericellopsis atlantica TaxID=2614577 RepID=A0A9P8CRF4_9HYPO|nr:60S acidic ribosomal protein P0 [Emericellopsis atlantica]KAG9256964.1 60S acidic ribosomal protein P0 [Emericellopsis atlantica]